jgi:cobalamin biosynthesis protein CobT
MGRKILNRKDLRADFDAAERRKDDTEEPEDEEEGDEEDDDEEGEEEEGGEAGPEEEADSDEDDEDEEKPKKKKKKKAPVPKAPPKPKTRTRVPKVVRMRVVWGVFSNNNQCVATYEYPKRKDADAHATRLSTEKRSTFFVQPVKEPIEEKKEK